MIGSWIGDESGPDQALGEDGLGQKVLVENDFVADVKEVSVCEFSNIVAFPTC